MQRAVEGVESMPHTLLLVSCHLLTTQLALPLARLTLVLVVMLLLTALHVAATAAAQYGSVVALVEVKLDSAVVFADGAGVLAAVLFVRTGDGQLLYQ